LTGRKYRGILLFVHISIYVQNKNLTRFTNIIFARELYVTIIDKKEPW
jgi:hypothetical protein